MPDDCPYFTGYRPRCIDVTFVERIGLDRKHLLTRRHQLQGFVDNACIRSPLRDKVMEVDEMYQNAGEKGIKHSDPNDPPRCRGNKARGHGTWDSVLPANQCRLISINELPK